MKLDEVIEKLNSKGINITKRTIQRYAKQGLISPPFTKAAGRGKGKIALYPPEAVDEAEKIYKLKNLGLSGKVIKAIVRHGGGPALDNILREAEKDHKDAV